MIDLENKEMCRKHVPRVLLREKATVTFDQKEASRPKRGLSSHMLRTVVVVRLMHTRVSCCCCCCCKLADVPVDCWCRGEDELSSFYANVDSPLLTCHWCGFSCSNCCSVLIWWRIEREALPSCKHAVAFFFTAIWILCTRVTIANETTERDDNCMWIQ